MPADKTFTVVTRQKFSAEPVQNPKTRVGPAWPSATPAWWPPARAHGDFMRMRAERDELEWLLQRGDARAAGTIAKSAAVQMDTEC